jgi:putative flippase GtrA
MKKLFRFAVVGIVSNLIGYLLYLYVTFLGAAPKVAMTVLYGIGALIGFIGNRKYTFAHKGKLQRAGMRYAVAHCAGYTINFLTQIVVVDQLGYPHQLAQAVGICVVAAFLFVTFKYFVFIEPNTAKV